MSGEVLIKAEHVGKKFCRDLKTSLWYGVKDVAADLIGLGSACDVLRPKEFWALEDISFEVKRGECLGLIGRNGAGKTTLLKMLNGLIKPDRGRIEMHGRVGALIALGAGFNPLLTGRENVYINGAVLGLGKKEIDRKFDEIVDFAELDQFIDSPVQSYSSGMQVRLGFAVATAMEPDILLLDEVLAVGDAAFRTKCFERIGKVLTSAAVIFVSHSESQIYRICDHAVLLSRGKIAEQGIPSEVLARYRLEQGEARPEAHRILHENLRDISIEMESRELGWGSNLRVQIRLQLSAPISVGAIIIHLWRNGEFVANGEVMFEELSSQIRNIAKEEECLSIDLGPLFLQNGTYFVSLSIFDETRKQTIIQWLHFSEIRMVGPLGIGPSHLVPMAACGAIPAQIDTGTHDKLVPDGRSIS